MLYLKALRSKKYHKEKKNKYLIEKELKNKYLLKSIYYAKYLSHLYLIVIILISKLVKPNFK